MNIRLDMLGFMPISKILEIMGSLRLKEVTSLDISYNELSSITASELILLLKAIPLTVEKLDLSSNGLNYFKRNELVEILRAIPKNIKLLILKENDLYKKTARDLTTLFKVPFQNMLSIDLSHNKLRVGGKLDQIIYSVPARVISIITEYHVLNVSELLAKQLMHSVYNHITEQNADQFTIEKILVPIEIDELRLTQLVYALEHFKTPLALFTAGLLLHKQSILFSKKYYQIQWSGDYFGYNEKLLHDAITLYANATQNTHLKPWVDAILRPLKSTSLVSSVQQRLMQFDIPTNTKQSERLNVQQNIYAPLVERIGLFSNNLFKTQSGSLCLKQEEPCKTPVSTKTQEIVPTVLHPMGNPNLNIKHTYTYGNNPRLHLFKAKHKHYELQGDRLKDHILDHFLLEVNQCMTRENLTQVILNFQKSTEYKIIEQAQGITTWFLKLFGLKETSSIAAFKKIKHRAEILIDQKNAMIRSI